MSRLILAGLALALAATAAAPPARAQAPAPASAAAPSEKTVKLVRRVLAATHMERQVDVMMTNLMPVLMEQQAKLHPNLTADDQKMILELTHKIIMEDFFPKLVERSVPIYASVYSDDELEAMARFYESPTGQAILAKAPLITPKVAEATRELMPQAMSEMVRQLCAKMNCLQSPPAAPPRPKAS
jgi:hypothetical protein